ncbi:hypothetical protein SDC9_101135 [bioreactor metagenome]|uniref:CdaA regulatory protein CdaR n=1 Tax=bioreactor metagenome TaxID=1076179 RepID=A0A645AMT9_9ZZZZ
MKHREGFSRLLEFVRHDFWRKLVALFLALLLYLAIAARLRSDERFSEVPVSLNLPATLVNRDNESLKVSLALRGNRIRLAELNPAALRVRADIDSASFVAGQPYKLRLRSSDVSGLPHGIRVVEISPRDLAVNLEAVITKKVPIRARFDSLSMLPLDYTVSGTRFTPSDVVLTGPVSMVESVGAVYTNPIPIDNQVTESFEYQVGLRIPEGVKSDRHKVDAQVDVVKSVTLRTFYAVPLLTVQSPESVRQLSPKNVEPKSVTVILSGPKGVLAMMRSDELKAYLDLDKLEKPGSFQIAVKVVLETMHPDVTVKSFQPATAEVTVVHN